MHLQIHDHLDNKFVSVVSSGQKVGFYKISFMFSRLM